MAALIVLALPEGVEVVDGGDVDGLVVRWLAGSMTLKRPSPGLAAALRALHAAGKAERELADLVEEEDGPAELPRFYYLLRRLGQAGLLHYAADADGRRLATLVPNASAFESPSCTVRATARYALSRFALCRRDGERLVVESPLARGRVVPDGPEVAGLLARLARPSTLEELGAAAGLGEEGARVVLELLLAAGLISEVGEDGTAPEEKDLALRQWEFHDLLFHSRTRQGRHDAPYGGTYRFLGDIPPLPAVKPAMAGEAVALERPDLQALVGDDVPFTAIMEGRRSVRTYGETPISLSQLGEFLYRTARVRAVFEDKPELGLLYPTSSRPYPDGGACYELELYLAVNRCQGLPSGLYHYDPLAHVLRKLRDRDDLVDRLIGDVAWVTQGACEPQVVIELAARFQRVSWKYQGMAYALILKHVGVLYQTMYLVATAMGLAPCGVGGGQADLLAQAIGADYQVESAVGEFMLGSRPES